MKQDRFQDAFRILTGDTPPRVWSLIVTVFGDLAQGGDDSISGALLGNILLPLGVRPEAMRVALHRLRGDGWIETKKRGREAHHALSASGLAESRAASELIYARTREALGPWHLQIFAPLQSGHEHSRSAALCAQGYVTLAPGVYLANGPLEQDAPDALVLQGSLGEIPGWLAEMLVTPAQSSALKDLTAALDLLSADGTDFSGATPLQIASLRALLVHRWRKLVLRQPAVPDVLFGKDWAGHICRARVMTLLDALPRPALTDL